MRTITASPAVPTVRRVSVRCSQCGDIEQLNDRSARRKAAEGRPHVCRLCRQMQNIRPTASDFNYWTSRYTPEEIQDLAAAIWG